MKIQGVSFSFSIFSNLNLTTTFDTNTKKQQPIQVFLISTQLKWGMIVTVRQRQQGLWEPHKHQHISGGQAGPRVLVGQGRL